MQLLLYLLWGYERTGKRGKVWFFFVLPCSERWVAGESSLGYHVWGSCTKIISASPFQRTQTGWLSLYLLSEASSNCIYSRKRKLGVQHLSVIWSQVRGLANLANCCLSLFSVELLLREERTSRRAENILYASLKLIAHLYCIWVNALFLLLPSKSSYFSSALNPSAGDKIWIDPESRK